MVVYTWILIELAVRNARDSNTERKHLYEGMYAQKAREYQQ